MDELIKLIHRAKSGDISNDIYAELKSTSRDESVAAGQAGYKNTLKFSIWSIDYDNQKLLEFEGKRLTIYRTYKVDSDHLELYAGERIGNRGN